ncbi:MAG: hypothetical protein PHR61_02110 [Candidatus Absconditabacteria bacterium]|nr:hypothetical protein [Candidatus Absconditabacteria bacterium]
MSRRLLVQRFETNKALREIFTAMGLGESLYRLIEIFREIDIGDN